MGWIAEEMKELWMEYENNSSAEAKLVKDFDKVSVIPWRAVVDSLEISSAEK